jgi:hypothetical protein
MDGSRQSFSRFDALGGDDDMASFSSQAERQRPADASAGTRDNGDAIF